MPAVLAEPEVVLVETPREVNTGGPGGGGPHDYEPGGNGWGGGDDEFARRPKGASLGMVGMIATLISITTLFATIVIAFMIRSQTRAYWRPLVLPGILWLSTGIMVVSSITLESARRALRRSQIQLYANRLAVTFFLGLSFLVSQAAALKRLASQGIYMRANPHSGLLYIITGAHAIHLFGGLMALFYLMLRAVLAPESLKSQQNIAAVTTVYWHFLDALWMGLFLFLLFWK